MKKIYATISHINDASFESLDFELQNSVGSDLMEDEFDTINKGGLGIAACGSPVKIDDLIEKLNFFKNDGATHVQIEEDVDHHGYLLSGFLVRLSTPDEIKKYEDEVKQKSKKWKEIQALQKQISTIQKQM